MYEQIEKMANSVRIRSIQMCSKGGSSHVGSVLSCVDILCLLYGKFIRYTLPQDSQRQVFDRFIMSKGHAGAGLYAILSYLGFVEDKILDTHYQNGSYLSGHVCHKLFPGIDFSTGSLGHGLPVACGVALSQKTLCSDRNTFVLMSDGELDEGSNWEAFLFASHHRLNNLFVFIDRNRLQSIESTEATLSLEPLESKLKSFGLNVYTVDGHSYKDMDRAIVDSLANSNSANVFICETTKGKGVSFMEDQVLWHYRSPSSADVELAIAELS